MKNNIKGSKKVRKIKEDLVERRLRKKLKKTIRGRMVDEDSDEDFGQLIGRDNEGENTL